MWLKLLDLLVCPRCSNKLRSVALKYATPEIIQSGELTCMSCDVTYAISDGIPRFVQADNYAASFGYQWNRFRKEQLDSCNGTTISAGRLWSETGWTKEELRGKWVLDAGCGAGRFIDAASASGGQIVGVDISSAIDAAAESLAGRENVHFVQASIYELPFKKGTFDYCYCIGVIQHTPDTFRSLASIAEVVKGSGKLAVTIYPRKPWTKLYSKYWLRPVTKRLKKQTLLRWIERLMPIAFPLTDALFRIPILGRGFMFAIPVANYVHEKQLTRDQRYAWAILDTFDMLSPYYDQPMTEPEAVRVLSQAGVSVTRTQEPGLNLVGIRTSGN